MLAGCLSLDNGQLRVRVDTSNLTNISANQSLNATMVPIPKSLSLCVFGAPAAEDKALEANLTCRGEAVKLELRQLSGTARPGDFAGCALIYLKDDAEGRYLDRALRAAVRQEVLAGSSLVLWGEAGTLVHDDEAVLGWAPELGDIVPATIAGPGKEPQKIGTVENASGTIDLTGGDALLEPWAGLGLSNANITEVSAENDPEVLAYMRTGPYTTSSSYYAVLRANPAGPVYYFSFDPQRHTPQQFSLFVGSLAGEYLSRATGGC